MVLIAGNNINLVNGNKITAFLWAKNKVVLNNASKVKGGIITPTIEAKNASEVEQVELPADFQVRVVGWQ